MVSDVEHSHSLCGYEVTARTRSAGSCCAHDVTRIVSWRLRFDVALWPVSTYSLGLLPFAVKGCR
jgi:hypothetical protein